jgi:hypothetical protein
VRQDMTKPERELSVLKDDMKAESLERRRQLPPHGILRAAHQPGVVPLPPTPTPPKASPPPAQLAPAPEKLSPLTPAKQFPRSAKEGKRKDLSRREVEMVVPDGIVAYLTRKCGGNVHDCHIVDVMSILSEKETIGTDTHFGIYSPWVFPAACMEAIWLLCLFPSRPFHPQVGWQQGARRLLSSISHFRHGDCGIHGAY